MSDRRLQALRALAERPGTEAEGILAREILARLQSQEPVDEYTPYRRWLRKEISLEEFLMAMKHPPLTPEEQAVVDAEAQFAELQRKREEERIHHATIQAEIRTRFKKGDRVYYNKWAYFVNDPGSVSGYVRPKEENGSHPWAWLSVKFDRHLWPRQIPVWSERGWHLSHEPLNDEEAERLRKA
jgi:hypothetical protein